MSTYYEVFGESRDKLLAFREERKAAFDQGHALTKKLGARGFMRHTSFGTEQVTAFLFTEKKAATVDGKVLRRYYNPRTKRHEDHFVPNRSTKEGKALAEEMRKIDLGGGADIGNIVGVDWFRGMSICTPGLRVFGKKQRVFIICDSEHKPNADCVRVADVEFEKLDAKEKSASKSKRKKQVA